MIKSFWHKLSNLKIKSNCLFNPFIRLKISSLGDYPGVNEGEEREVPIIVSLWCKQDEIPNLPVTIYSLLNQNLKPDRIILWLDKETEDLLTLPYEITQFVKNGLEIKFVRELGVYTKTIYPLREFRNSVIVTAESDIYYPSNWLKKLYLSYISDSESIHVHNALLADKNTPFSAWEIYKEKETASFNIFPISQGGILYPPNCFTSEVFREDIYLKNCPNSDNLWFWIMALVNNRKFRLVKNYNKFIIYNNFFKCLSINNNQNDNNFNNLMKFYRQNIEKMF